MMDTDVLINVAAQIPIVAAFSWFVIYLLRYTKEQLEHRDKTWENQLSDIRSDHRQTIDRVMATVETQDERWREFVKDRDERYRVVLKEIQDAIQNLK